MIDLHILDADERTRIQRAGGSVSADGRLNGRLQIARSFGDIAFKQVCLVTSHTRRLAD